MSRFGIMSLNVVLGILLVLATTYTQSTLLAVAIGIMLGGTLLASSKEA